MANISETTHSDHDADISTESTHVTSNPSQTRSGQVSPPYWQHQRSISAISQASLRREGAITLSDNTGTDVESPSQSTLWAKTVSVTDYAIVRGNPTGIGAYVVFTCQVETLDGGPMTIRKRYSEFVELRYKLAQTFPHSTKKSLPILPPKSAIYKFRPQFLEKRRSGLEFFLICVMLSPEYAGTDAVKDFIFGQER